MSIGRFYISPDGQPHFNMAFDEWLLSRAIVESECLFLRLYTWSEGCLTFGLNQKEEKALDFSKIGSTPVIRRVSGGRALYHDESELTYTIAFNVEAPPVEALSGSIGRTSGVISAILQAFLTSIGIGTEQVKQSSGGFSRVESFHKNPCLASFARHELMATGRKIVASAQRRIGAGLLQHGSIKLSAPGSHAALPGVRESVAESQSIETQQFEQFSSRFRDSFSEGLGLDIGIEELTECELAQVDKITDKIKKNPFIRRLR